MTESSEWPPVSSLPGAGGLYLHIPYCARACPYCAFIKTESDRGVPDGYVAALVARIRNAGAHFGRPVVQSIFFGGGTPSLLTAEQYGLILDACRDGFAVEDRAEITSEANPNSATEDLLDGMRAAGVNRVSFGAQSFVDAELTFLGRLHGSDDIELAVSAARSVGFSNVNLDLMYGLPRQGVSDWQYSLDRAIHLGVEHLSFYSLTPEPGTRLFDDVKAGSTVLAADDVQREMYQATLRTVETAGYHSYEISNAAATGYDCRHNRVYWEGGFYIGLGPGAHSFAGGVRWAEVGSIDTWRERVESGVSVVAMQEAFDPATRAFEMLMLGLRLAQGADLGRIRSVTGEDPTAGHEERIASLMELGLMLREGDVLRLTREGRFVADGVISQFVPD
jgi:oxygen-independent coproporphyrinogen-3 oxidase